MSSATSPKYVKKSKPAAEDKIDPEVHKKEEGVLNGTDHHNQRNGRGRLKAKNTFLQNYLDLIASTT